MGQQDTRSAVPGQLPDYTVRVSSRAKRIRLAVTPRDGVVVIVPSGASMNAEAIVRERRQWILAALADLAEQRRTWTCDPAELLPDRIAFAATGESWSVEYRTAPSTRASARTLGGAVVVTGGATDPEQRLRALQRWLHRRAVERLLPMLAEEAARVGVTPLRASVRGQRYRWAGCSHAGAITLNRALLFLEPELVCAAMLHELAHVSVPDHSAGFWRLLADYDPRLDAHRTAIAAARDAVPGWAERH